MLEKDLKRINEDYKIDVMRFQETSKNKKYYKPKHFNTILLNMIQLLGRKTFIF